MTGFGTLTGWRIGSWRLKPKRRKLSASYSQLWRVEGVPRKHMKHLIKYGAGDEIRTHDPNLGKVVLYP